jgi:hypothetical protein
MGSLSPQLARSQDGVMPAPGKPLCSEHRFGLAPPLQTYAMSRNTETIARRRQG